MGSSSTGSVKEEIKRAADIVEVVGQFVNLRKAGRVFVGLCPFHAEKSPSFTVSPERQMFHCFGCKKGGDVFAFWMGYHQTTFPEALRDLGARYGILVPFGRDAEETRKQESLKERLYQINAFAAQWFEERLAHQVAGAPARAYLEERGFTGAVVRDFRLGYAPNTWDGLSKALTARGEDLQVAFQAGLLVQKEKGGGYDRFRGRLMFPILNMRNQVMGFGGRVLDNGLPKYLNSPETPIFKKGDLPYGLHASHKAIREMGRALVVEGYMDLLALWTHGIPGGVASLGTALTREQVRKIRGYCQEIVLIFDADPAGRAATLRALPLLLDEGLSARAVRMPEGEDPDTFLKTWGPEAFLSLIEKAVPVFDVFAEEVQRKAGTDVEGRVRALDEILPVLAEIPNQAQRALYVRKVASFMDLGEQVIWEELAALGRKTSTREGPRILAARFQDADTARRYGRDMHFLNLIVHYPGTMARLVSYDWKGFLNDPVVMTIVETCFRHFREHDTLEVDSVLGSMDDPEASRLLREVLILPPIFKQEDVQWAVAELVARAEEEKLSKRIRDVRQSGDLLALNEILRVKAQRSECLTED